MERLKRMAEEAQAELAAKTEELRQLEAQLSDANSSALAKSISSVADLLHAKSEKNGTDMEMQQQVETRSVIESSLV